MTCPIHLSLLLRHLCYKFVVTSTSPLHSCQHQSRHDRQLDIPRPFCSALHLTEHTLGANQHILVLKISESAMSRYTFATAWSSPPTEYRCIRVKHNHGTFTILSSLEHLSPKQFISPGAHSIPSNIFRHQITHGSTMARSCPRHGLYSRLPTRAMNIDSAPISLTYSQSLL
ncbi:hypothetical protein AUEXF2481DRAFT_422611 [Aureobasidium subglaciale EXF-2481]|uniref:Uncharacterized protein n=1 Tax=Aureobasidium subglaciale (strain EXF-2481) TaxID=1043005 RepID=A0A074Y435_AURSE|nr:uncharacterized protein AUEXF2481DRAFT_422611 [Aureobasidium subglaciale EXF-2481]KAI5197075.1 hypothetical protein E4T38_08193 [Aureobasidium subglaciale]KAI5215750.1 hypothetical protein E4T40_08203 [Aureobasidium subglaciale]KAI5219049.1 hypothetical protein E4T41_08118 [Aureobasidium subglaciale]KAI5256589.1 hypothetical protein E4T46_08094 [Aureobasidium subglaciale]KEQ92553.1 hypothetical protein AUEXF2481DRAFT_422611 [Aureobasidium subglaciale EXF-2481]